MSTIDLSDEFGHSVATEHPTCRNADGRLQQLE
jgi:hypothetical protein